MSARLTSRRLAPVILLLSTAVSPVAAPPITGPRELLYVGNNQGGTFKILKRLEFAEGVRPFDITADERKMYVQLSKLHGFLEFDLQADRITKTVHLPVPPGVTHQKASRRSGGPTRICRACFPQCT